MPIERGYIDHEADAANQINKDLVVLLHRIIRLHRKGQGFSHVVKAAEEYLERNNLTPQALRGHR